jgi:predicted KAP-like P-loop ATPase
VAREKSINLSNTYVNENNSPVAVGINDQPAKNDTLGFKPYVKAIADFLTDTFTEPPLTISIEGQWESGKSSFMLQQTFELPYKTTSIKNEYRKSR